MDRQEIVEAAQAFQASGREDSTDLIAALLAGVDRDGLETVLTQIVNGELNTVSAFANGTDAEHAYQAAGALEDISRAVFALAQMRDPMHPRTFPTDEELRAALEEVHAA